MKLFKRSEAPHVVSCSRVGRFCVLLPLVSLLCALPAQADSVVTNCTQDALAAALATGGTVSFTQACSLSLSSTISIGANATIDANGQNVSLLGNNTFRLITVL